MKRGNCFSVLEISAISKNGERCRRRLSFSHDQGEGGGVNSQSKSCLSANIAFAGSLSSVTMSMSVIEALNKVQGLSTQLCKFGSEIATFCENDETFGEEGISLLQAKSATLMRYNRNLVRLAQARVKGKTIESIAEKLVQDWVALEKIRPLERKLRHQIDKLLKTASRKGSTNAGDADRHRPDPSALVFDSDADGSAGEEDDGVYRPPRIAEVIYDAGGEKKAARERKERERAQARAMRSEGVREMLAEVKGLPEEIRDDEMGGTQKNAAVQRLLREDEKRRKYEEENFTRLNVTRKDKKRRRDIERAMEGPALDGADEFAGLTAVADRVFTRKGTGSGKKEGKERNETNEEQYKLHKLDEITEAMEGNGRKSSSRKRRRR